MRTGRVVSIYAPGRLYSFDSIRLWPLILIFLNDLRIFVFSIFVDNEGGATGVQTGW